MKKTRLNKITALFVALYVTVFVFASSGALAAESNLKIGGVSLQGVVDGSKAGKSALNAVKRKAEKERDVIVGKQKAIKNLETELAQKGLMMVESSLEEKRARLSSLKREFELYRRDVQQAIQRSQNKEIRKLMKEILAIIKVYSKKNGYNLIIEKGSAGNLGGGTIVFMEDALDITPMIIKIYNAQYDKAHGAG